MTKRLLLIIFIISSFTLLAQDNDLTFSIRKACDIVVRPDTSTLSYDKHHTLTVSGIPKGMHIYPLFDMGKVTIKDSTVSIVPSFRYGRQPHLFDSLQHYDTATLVLELIDKGGDMTCSVTKKYQIPSPQLSPVDIHWMYRNPLHDRDIDTDYVGNRSFTFDTVRYRDNLAGDSIWRVYNSIDIDILYLGKVNTYHCTGAYIDDQVLPVFRKLQAGMVLTFRLNRTTVNGQSKTETVTFRLISFVKTVMLKRQNIRKLNKAMPS